MEKKSIDKKGSERDIQNRLSKEEGARTEVNCPAGRVDAITQDEIIEIKIVRKWKAALGQVLAYGRFFPDKSLRIHLFGDTSERQAEIVEKTCDKMGVRLTWESSDRPSQPLPQKSTKNSASTRKAKKNSRKHLTESEVRKLMQTAKELSRFPLRDQCMIFMAFRHGLRRTELCELTWLNVNLEAQTLYVKRLDGGRNSSHPIGEEELQLIEEYKHSQMPDPPGTFSWMFTNRNGKPVKPDSFRQTLKRLGIAAGFSFQIHPHMLRHGCGYALVEQGHDIESIQYYMGHRDIKNTLIYTEPSPTELYQKDTNLIGTIKWYEDIGLECPDSQRD